MEPVEKILAELAQFKQTPECAGLELRQDFADLILRGLASRGWTQKELAQRAGMKPSFISRLVHANANCTLDVVAKVLRAFGVSVRLVATTPLTNHNTNVSTSTSDVIRIANLQEMVHGKACIKEERTVRYTRYGRINEPQDRGPSGHHRRQSARSALGRPSSDRDRR